MTEEEAREDHNNVAAYTFPFEDNDRANTEEERNGFAKIICDKKGKILGAHIIGPHSGEYLHELVLAMKHGLTIDSIMNTIHAYPTLGRGTQTDCFSEIKGEPYALQEKTDKESLRIKGLTM